MALKGLDIFKLTPKTNCKECGNPTCMAFAMLAASWPVMRPMAAETCVSRAEVICCIICLRALETYVESAEESWACSCAVMAC